MNRSFIRQINKIKFSHLPKSEIHAKKLLLIPKIAYDKSFETNFSCWYCNRELNKDELKIQFCPCSSQRILPANKNLNYFELFNLNFDYKIDKATLTKNFRQLMRKLHPDLFTQKSEIEKHYSAEQSSLVNKAYKILSSPIERGIYMLELLDESFDSEIIQSHQTDAEKKHILMEILELNEIIDEIKDSKEVEVLEKRLEEIMKPFEDELAEAFIKKDYKAAASTVSKMKYYKNVDERLKDLKLKFNLTNA